MSGMRLLSVVVHDCAPSTWAQCERVMAAVTEVADVPLTLLAVPDYHHLGGNVAFDKRLDERRLRGDELALHGYSHVDDKPCSGLLARLERHVYTRGEGEFSAVNEVEARYRIDAGRAWFRHNRWPLHGFVAPAWLLSGDAWHVVRASGFEYTSTLRELVLLPGGGRPDIHLPSQPIVYSVSTWARRKLSLAWNGALMRLLSRADAPAVARIELHPWDANHADTRRSLQQALSLLLRDRQAKTTCEALRHWHRGQEASASRKLTDLLRPSSTSGHPSSIQ